MRFAIHLHPEQTGGSLDEARLVLRECCELGFEWVELAPHALDLVYDGRVNAPRLRAVLDLVRPFDLRYTVHAPNVLNLMDFDRIDLQKRAFGSCLDICEALHAPILVYHAGVVYRPWRPPAEPPADLGAAMRLERECLAEAAEQARRRGVIIAVENSNVEPGMAKGSYYASGARVDDLARQVRSVGHPAVVMAFDFGHARTAGSYFGFDWVGALLANQHLVQHWHMYDTFGKANTLPWQFDHEYECFYGVDDLHIPLGWGDTPYGEVLPMLASPEGIVVLEVKPRYRAEFGSSLARARELWARAGRSSASSPSARDPVEEGRRAVVGPP